MALKFAIIGSGPAGFFTLKSLVRQLPECKVDMFGIQMVTVNALDLKNVLFLFQKVSDLRVFGGDDRVNNSHYFKIVPKSYTIKVYGKNIWKNGVEAFLLLLVVIV